MGLELAGPCGVGSANVEEFGPVEIWVGSEVVWWTGMGEILVIVEGFGFVLGLREVS